MRFEMWSKLAFGAWREKKMLTKVTKAMTQMLSSESLCSTFSAEQLGLVTFSSHGFRSFLS